MTCANTPVGREWLARIPSGPQSQVLLWVVPEAPLVEVRTLRGQWVMSGDHIEGEGKTDLWEGHRDRSPNGKFRHISLLYLFMYLLIYLLLICLVLGIT